MWTTCTRKYASWWSGVFDKLHFPQGFLAWAIEIARRRVKAHFSRKVRDEKRFAHLDAVTDAALRDANSQPVISQPSEDLLLRLRSCLGKLNDQQRKLIELRYGDKPKPWHEVAVQLADKEGKLRTALFRVRLGLRSCIQSRSDEAQFHEE